VTWESIQRVELCEDLERIWEILLDTTQTLGCDVLRLSCHRQGRTVFQRASDGAEGPETGGGVAGASATFRLSSGRDLLLTVSLHQASDSAVAADIAFRFLQRLALATAERLERVLHAADAPGRRPLATVAEAAGVADSYHSVGDSGADLAMPALADHAAVVAPRSWLRWAFGWAT